MILNHAYRFVFIKTRKTASTSHEIALSKYCGAGDIVTPIVTKDEEARRLLGFAGPQNYEKPWHRYGPRDVARLVVKGMPARRFYNHMPARDARVLLGEPIWSSYYSFAFDRNPWDKVLSHYFWYRSLRHDRSDLDIATYLDTGRHLRVRNIDLYSDAGEIIVTKVFRYEDMNAALKEIAERLSLPTELELPKTKATQRTDRRPYRDVLTSSQAKRIGADFEREIDLLGYVF